MAHNAYITTLKNVRKHPNADRLQLGECFGNTVCVNLDYVEGMIGIYFPSDLQLSEEFATVNNLVRKKDDAGNNIGGYMDPAKRNVTAIRLRGEKSDGLFLPLSCLEYTGVNLDDLNIGDAITVVNGHELCQKYIPRTNNRSASAAAGNKTRKKKVKVSPLFAEHADTEQLVYNLSDFKPGDQIEITLKMHGTSQRTGYLPVFKGYKTGNVFFDKVLKTVNPDTCGKYTLKLYNLALNHAVPIYDWGYVSGTRRTVLENYDGGYYGSNEFREEHSKMFEGKLWKGETVYYEVVGFTTDGSPIMGVGKNNKVGKRFVKQYGDTTTFSYGCEPGQSDMYVYRMTMTNEDGNVIEYTPDFMRYRCEQMGIKTVPLFWKGAISKTTNELVQHSIEFQLYDISDSRLFATCGKEELIRDAVQGIAEKFYDGPDPVGKTHTKEGVVVRIINRPKFTAYKHKNFEFKVLEGIIKDAADAPDIEEAESIAEEVESA